MATVVLEGVTKKFRDVSAVDNLSLTIRDGGTHTWAGSRTTGEPGKYLLGIPSFENHTVLASKPEYGSINQETGLRGGLDLPKPVLSWETAANKSYLIPALEIPGFIFALNGFDHLAYRDKVEDGKKSTAQTTPPSGTTSSTARGVMTRTSSM